jgi:hypothetical protein
MPTSARYIHILNIPINILTLFISSAFISLFSFFSSRLSSLRFKSYIKLTVNPTVQTKVNVISFHKWRRDKTIFCRLLWTLNSSSYPPHLYPTPPNLSQSQPHFISSNPTNSSHAHPALSKPNLSNSALVTWPDPIHPFPPNPSHGGAT